MGLYQSVMPFYMYDRVYNRQFGPATYDLGDASNIFYTSSIFHSVEYVKTNKTTVQLQLRNVTKCKSWP